MTAETLRGFDIGKARGGGVVVLVWEVEIVDDVGTREVLDRRPAATWVELAELGAEYGVPQEQWVIDEDAREVLDADSP
ncbi:hypothetical protein [Streptacidiphilus anmyonensis]|uniref:hypothetical protein n=1 Tax=Streptacidiphilus anmyonensis TaxID=405782 RepID=UPI0005A762EB|nr:hypothetical protein [Streptacidiphilus anmyonensis]